MKTLLLLVFRSYFASGKFVQFLALFSHKACARVSGTFATDLCKMNEIEETKKENGHGIDLQARQIHKLLLGKRRSE